MCIHTHIYIFLNTYIYICLYPLETIKELTLTQKVKAYTAHGCTPVDSLTDDFSKEYKVQVSPYHPIVWGANFFFVVQLWVTVPKKCHVYSRNSKKPWKCHFFRLVRDSWRFLILQLSLWSFEFSPVVCRFRCAMHILSGKTKATFFSASNIEHFGDLRQHHDGQPLQMWWKGMERTKLAAWFFGSMCPSPGPPSDACCL